MNLLPKWLLGLMLANISCFCFAAANFTDDKIYQPGFYPFYLDKGEGKIYLEISNFNTPFIFQSSLPYGIGSNDIGLDRGQLGNTRLVQFERIGKKVFLRQLNTRYRAISDNVLEQQSIQQAFASSIIWGFEVSSEQQAKTYIDYTPFLLSDIHNIARYLETSELGNYRIDNSRSGIYAKRSKAFPRNTELEATVTYTGTSNSEFIDSVTPEPSAISVNLHHSLIALPEPGYQPRSYHPYSGYWDERYLDYSAALDEPISKRVITRHRLQKKYPEQAISVAKEPIIYYLDPGVPEPIKSALIDGALWWNQAFTAIGYEHAFQVKMLPADADPMDVRYNVIQWVHRATRGWSYGSTVTDPRTGEIIKGHVTLGSLRARQDYLIASGLTSPFINPDADTRAQQAMALARIRQLSAHEVGHTLGIAHNFAASSNNRASVMDYPHPKIELVDGKINLDNAYSVGIGEWDKYVIAYGYSHFPNGENPKALNQLISQAKVKGLRYMSDPDARPSSAPHAYAHLWDNGEDPIKELNHLLKVREIALKQFGINSIATGTPLSELEQVLVPIYHLHRYQTEAVASLIAGAHYDYELKTSAPTKGIRPVAANIQQQAITALINNLNTQLLSIPQSISKLIPPKAYGYERNRENFSSHTGLTFDPVTAAEAAAKHSISLLLNHERLARLSQQTAMDKAIPNVDSVIEQLIAQTIQQTAATGTPRLIQQRVNTQLITQLLTLWHNPSTVAEVKATIYQQLNKTNSWLSEHSKRRHQHNDLFAHYKMLQQMIADSLKQTEAIKQNDNLTLPPGSPI